MDTRWKSSDSEAYSTVNGAEANAPKGVTGPVKPNVEDRKASVAQLLRLLERDIYNVNTRRRRAKWGWTSLTRWEFGYGVAFAQSQGRCEHANGGVRCISSHIGITNTSVLWASLSRMAQIPIFSTRRAKGPFEVVTERGHVKLAKLLLISDQTILNGAETPSR